MNKIRFLTHNRLIPESLNKFNWEVLVKTFGPDSCTYHLVRDLYLLAPTYTHDILFITWVPHEDFYARAQALRAAHNILVCLNTEGMNHYLTKKHAERMMESFDFISEYHPSHAEAARDTFKDKYFFFPNNVKLEPENRDRFSLPYSQRTTPILHLGGWTVRRAAVIATFKEPVSQFSANWQQDAVFQQYGNAKISLNIHHEGSGSVFAIERIAESLFFGACVISDPIASSDLAYYGYERIKNLDLSMDVSRRWTSSAPEDVQAVYESYLASSSVAQQILRDRFKLST